MAENRKPARTLDNQPPRHRTQQGEVPPQPPTPHRHWVWPLGIALAGLGGAAAFMLRGCWHTHMGWPLKFDEEFSYQVCTTCGIKRLYDEKTFHAYGPYGYDLHELVARERALRVKRLHKHTEAMTKAAGPKKSEEQAETTAAE